MAWMDSYRTKVMSVREALRCVESHMRVYIQPGCAEPETYLADDAEVLVVGYGIVSRVLRSAVQQVRKFGLRAGLFRPITLWPFPSKVLAEAAARCRSLLVVELSTGQMVEDVRLALDGRVPVEFYGRSGGNVPGAEEIRDRLLAKAADLVAVG
jgi:pyruvate/2-oxoacid:ferredoxin oxidoreductase alpha subunit